MKVRKWSRLLAIVGAVGLLLGVAPPGEARGGGEQEAEHLGDLR